MKIIATVRTKNEERNIGEFCRSYYQWVDKILVADGGSTDRTKEIAEKYPKVTVLDFDAELPLDDGSMGNPQGKHFEFLRDQAIGRGADWIIFDDCDCFPNYELKARGRQLLEEVSDSCVMVHRVYFYGDKIFPNLHRPGPSMWAYNPNRFFVTAGHERPWRLELKLPPHEQRVAYNFPIALLHHPWPTPELAEEKIEYYKRSGRHPDHMQGPLEFGGPLAPPEPFMRKDP